MTHTSHPLTTHYFDLPTHRRMAYSQVGHVDAPRVLLCLPGLLETRATFDPLLYAAAHRHGVRVISVDYCGRGDSDPLHGDKGYTMSVYLHDVKAFLHHEVMRADLPLPRIELLGTSMGGILSMYLAHDKHNHIEGLFLNDIGLDLPWMSIYGLYDGMKKDGRLPEPYELAQQLNVTLGAVMAVQSPTHFDLSYRKSWKGMQFGHLLNHFDAPLRLVCGGDSGVCMPEQVLQLQRSFPKAKVLEVSGAAHPVPFTDTVNHFILDELRLPDAPVHAAHEPTTHHAVDVQQAVAQRPSPAPVQDDLAPLLQETEATAQTQKRRLLSWVKRLFS
jgi:pimeloyl-ACP methyl ester carboxylesterase